jgi:hypothetical protein
MICILYLIPRAPGLIFYFWFMDKYNDSPKAYVDRLLDVLYDMSNIVYAKSPNTKLLHLKIRQCMQLLREFNKVVE